MRVALCDLCGDVASVGAHSNGNECFIAGIGFTICKSCGEELVRHAEAMQVCNMVDTTVVTVEPSANLTDYVEATFKKDED